jgi:hypothetical protein
MTDTWLVWGLCGDLGVESLMHDGRSKQIIMMFSHRTYQTNKFVPTYRNARGLMLRSLHL